jgi:hypothetical protein
MAGMAIDFGMVMDVRQRAQAYVDASSLRLAAEKAQIINSGNANIAFDDASEKKTLSALLNALPSARSRGEPVASYADASVRIQASLEYKTFIIGLLGFRTLQFDVVAQAAYPKSSVKPFSVGFVLDVSDTMNDISTAGQSRLYWLKRSVRTLFSEIQRIAGPDALSPQVIKVTHASFNDMLMDRGNLTSNYTTTQTEINRYVAYGGTNSSPAMDYVFNKLNNAGLLGEDKLSYVIFLTDGLNNQASSTTYTVRTCDEFKRLGTKIIAIGLMDTTPRVIKDCASGTALTHQTLSGTVLEQLFADIAKGISIDIKQAEFVRLTK